MTQTSPATPPVAHVPAQAPPPGWQSVAPVNVAGTAVDPRWHQPQYVVKERRFTLGRQYRIFDAHGQLVAYCKQKLFKLREDIRFYTGEDQTVELFRLRTHKILDWNANFEVVESASNRRLGILRRKGWSSLLRDEWHIFDPWERPLGVLKEDTAGMALLRRFLAFINLGWLIPYKYFLHRDRVNEQRPLAEIEERFQLFGDTYDVHVSPEMGVDARVFLGLTVCVDAVEGE